MAIERVLGASSAAPLLGGLAWRPLTAKKHTVRTLAEAKRLVGEATHYTLLKTAAGAAYGLFQPRPSEEGEKLPKSVFSAAAAFAALVGEAAPRAALVVTVPGAVQAERQADDGQQQQAQKKVYVVLLEDGIPVTDTITDAATARNIVGSDPRPIYSDDFVSYPTCSEIDFEWLLQGASKAIRVAPIPVNPVPYIILTLVVAMLAGGYYVHAKKKKEEEQRKLAEAAAAADPVPKYLGGLAAQREQMTTDREQMLKGLLEIYQSPVVVPGWVLTAVECDATAKTCNSAWSRKGGTFEDIQKARKGEKLVPTAAGNGGMPSLDDVVMQRPFEVSRATLIEPDKVLPSLEQIVISDGPMLQVWKNASIAVEYKQPLLWPAHPEVPPTFTHPQAVMRGEVAVRDLIAPFAIEALKAAPSNVSWEKLRVDVVPGADAKSRLKVELTGHFYVSNQAPV